MQVFSVDCKNIRTAFITKRYFKLGKNSNENFEMSVVYVGQKMSKEGWEEGENGGRSGRSRFNQTCENMEKIRQLEKSDRRLSTII